MKSIFFNELSFRSNVILIKCCFSHMSFQSSVVRSSVRSHFETLAYIEIYTRSVQKVSDFFV